MNDIVSLIAQRLAGTQTGLQPLIRSRFEPLAADAPPLQEQHGEIEAARQPSAPRVQGASSRDQIAGLADRVDATGASVVPASPGRPAQTATGMQAPSSPMPSLQDTGPTVVPAARAATTQALDAPASQPIVRETETVIRETRTATPPAAAATVQMIARERLTRLETRVMEHHGAADRAPELSATTPSPTLTPTSLPATPLPAPPPGLKPVPVVAGQVLPRQSHAPASSVPPMPAPQLPRAAETEPALVQIRIERLEVRVQPTKAAPRSAVPERPGAAPDLDTYLNELERRR